MRTKILALSFIFFSQSLYAGETCHYKYTVWNTIKKSTVKTVSISKSKAALTKEEKGPYGCTPCWEDQETITLINNQKVTVCKHVAKKIKTALDTALTIGVPIKTIRGYRASKSRGPVDANGNRTRFSNHAYGVALDINEMNNGLYYNCKTWSKSCTLRKGGPYNPNNPLSFTKNSPVVKKMKKIGFRWGGVMDGAMKDFMHFSPDGK